MSATADVMAQLSAMLAHPTAVQAVVTDLQNIKAALQTCAAAAAGTILCLSI